MAYRLVHEEVTSEWARYDGEGEVGIAEWEGNFTVESMVQAQREEIASHGGTLLSLRIWQDGNLWFTESVVHGSPFLPFAIIFAAIGAFILRILPFVMILLIMWAAIPVLKGIQGIIHGPPPVQDPETGEWYYPEGGGGGLFGGLTTLFIVGGAVIIGTILVSRFMKPKPRQMLAH